MRNKLAKLREQSGEGRQVVIGLSFTNTNTNTNDLTINKLEQWIHLTTAGQILELFAHMNIEYTL